MNKITIKKIPFKLQGIPIEENEKLEFKAKWDKEEDFNLQDIKGKKVISIFPDINTSICDNQTREIARLAALHENITFVSISTDPVEVQRKWCAANNAENIVIVSDKEYLEFANKTNLYVTKIKKLSRGFILLNEDNIIKGIALNTELASDPDYGLLEAWIK